MLEMPPVVVIRKMLKLSIESIVSGGDWITQCSLKEIYARQGYYPQEALRNFAQEMRVQSLLCF
jgi:hypothetical protein